jgi:carbon monoxide dehydrogenase subunit G
VDEIRFEPLGAGTRVIYTADIRLGGVMALVQPFLGGAFEKLFRSGADGMKRALERRAAARATALAPDGAAPR